MSKKPKYKNSFIVPPQIHPFDFGEEAINAGDIVMANCLVTKGDLPIKIYWRLNNKDILDFGGISAINPNKRASQLTIESVQAHHTGEYKCLAENRAGIAEFSTFLNVKGTFNFACVFLLHPSFNLLILGQRWYFVFFSLYFGQ